MPSFRWGSGRMGPLTVLLPLLLGSAGCGVQLFGGDNGELAARCTPTDVGVQQAQIAPGVTQYRCQRNDGDVAGIHIITIDPSRTNSELWVLETPLSTNEPEVGRFLDQRSLRDLTTSYKALVAINSFTFKYQNLDLNICWEPDGTDSPYTRVCPATTVFESTHQISTSLATNEGFGPEYLWTFGPTAHGSPISLTLPDETPPASLYNAYASVWPALIDGECTTSFEKSTVHTVLGYSNDTSQIVMFLDYGTGSSTREVCTVLENFQVTRAVYQDGGESFSGLYINSENALDGRQRIGSSGSSAYALGLVELGGEQVQNGSFEAPVVQDHHVRGGDTNDKQEFNWLGDNPPDFESWRGRTVYYTQEPRAEGDQVAGLRSRSPRNDYLEQWLPETPAETYCMLRFFHGFKPLGLGCIASASELTVSIDGRAYRYGSANNSGVLREEWLRFRTSEAGGTSLRFEASFAPYLHERCEVRLDSVSVRCVNGL